MQYIARWGPKGFLCTPKKVVPFEGFSTTIAAKTKNQENTKGKDKTQIQGLELEKMSFSTTYVKGAGVDPLAQVEEWRSLVKKAYPLYIGGKRFGPDKMLLTEVGVDDTVFSNDGVLLSVRLDISLEEYADGKTTATTIDNSVPDSYSGYSTALKVTASAEDKAARKS